MRLAVLLLAISAASSMAGASATSATKPVLPFIEDDYAHAISEARREHRPLFVDAWAPWCHTCRSMRAFVFTDPALAGQARRFVWLSVDTEKLENAPFLASHQVTVWPTLMVLDPETEQTMLRWPGSMGVPQLIKLLDDGERAVRGNADAGVKAIVAADRLAAAGKPKEAAEAYRTALGHVGPDKRPRIIEAMVTALLTAHDNAACAKSAVELAPGLPRTSSLVNVVALGLDCAHGATDEQKQSRAALIPLAQEALKVTDSAADDRSALFDSLVTAYEADHNEAARKEAAVRWFAFVHAEAEHAPTAEQRAVFDPHTASAAIALGEPLRAVPALTASERDFPHDYNPPARLANVYLHAGKFDDALAASDRALSKIYGPRSIEVYLLKARIQDKKGDHEGAHKTMDQAMTIATALPVAQRRDAMVARVKQQQAEPAR